MGVERCQRCNLELSARRIGSCGFVVEHVHDADGVRVLRRLGADGCLVPVVRFEAGRHLPVRPRRRSPP